MQKDGQRLARIRCQIQFQLTAPMPLTVETTGGVYILGILNRNHCVH